MMWLIYLFLAGLVGLWVFKKALRIALVAKRAAELEEGDDR